MNILLLAGSPSNQSRSTRLLHYVGGQQALREFHQHILNVRDLPAEALLHADFTNAELKAVQEQVRQADAIIVSTPVYQAAYSGILKAFLDLLPQTGLTGKLVLPLATGGSQSHMLALDYALRPVLSALGAKHILPSIYATEAQIQWNSEQGLLLDASIAERVTDGVEHLADSLTILRQQRQYQQQQQDIEQASLQSNRCSA
jgi:FMN reductase